mmetsp:Transcript_9967/g.22236  ORF Transcript_9967/g.22236 Transcript_9967/m.22236 type:complete len:188 (-) Transcript_9967:96-659(-)
MQHSSSETKNAPTMKQIKSNQLRLNRKWFRRTNWLNFRRVSISENPPRYPLGPLERPSVIEALEENSASWARQNDQSKRYNRAINIQDPDFSELGSTSRSENIIPSASIDSNRRYVDQSRSSRLVSIAAAAVRAIDCNDPIEGEKILKDMKNASSDNSLLALRLQEMVVLTKKGTFSAGEEMISVHS